MHSTPLHLRSVNASKRTVDFIASSEAIDSYDEVIDQRSWRLDRYLANPVVLYAHNSRELPIGYAKNVRVEDGKLQCSVQFVDAKANPIADNVWHSIEQGSLRAVSVGFIPNTVKAEKRNGRDVFVLSDCELHELSVVPIPANPEATAKMKIRALAESGHPLSLQPTAPASSPSSFRSGLTSAECMTLDRLDPCARSLIENGDLATGRETLARLAATAAALDAQRDRLKEITRQQTPRMGAFGGAAFGGLLDDDLMLADPPVLGRGCGEEFGALMAGPMPVEEDLL